MKLKSIEILNAPNRITSVDFYRGLAIILVVFHHYNNYLFFGNIGVDLFFVISGFLVGGLLINQYRLEKTINFLKFFIQRGFKIWPSYYFFLGLGTFLAYLMYSETNPDQIIPLNDMKRYLFFYQNYTGLPFHWSFDHIWSLCVEEHFYIILPIFLILAQKCHFSSKTLIYFFLAGVILGISFKFCSYYLTNSKDTYSATHNRIDALSWGVILQLIVTYHNDLIKNFKYKLQVFLIGLILSVSIIYFNSLYIDKVLYHSIVPFSFFLILFSTYYLDFKRMFLIRFIAYYSYNWYLWHHVFILYFYKNVGKDVLSLFLYILFTFCFSMIITIIVEEKMLKLRSRFIDIFFQV